MMRPLLRAFLSLIAMTLAAETPAAAQAGIPLRFGVIDNSARNVSSLPLYIGQRQGFFAREGIELKVVQLRGVEHQIEGLEDGTVEVAHTATPYLVQAVLRGSDAIGVIGAPANQIFTLLARPEIKSYADLKGKLVAMSLPQDTISIATRLLLDKHGLKAGDYRTVDLIGTGTRVDCLVKGECFAAAANQPADLALMKKGYTRLGDSLEVIPTLQFSVIAARKSWAAAHKDTLVRFARGFAAAYRFMREPRNRDAVARLMVETTDTPPGMARDILALYFEPDRGVMPKQAEIDIKGIEAVTALLAQTGQIAKPAPVAARLIDLQYLKAAGLQ